MNPSPIVREYLEQGSSAMCPIIDMHGHVGPFYGCYLPSSPLGRMRHRLKRCGVRRTVCSHHSALACDAERGNAVGRSLPGKPLRRVTRGGEQPVARALPVGQREQDGHVSAEGAHGVERPRTGASLHQQPVRAS